MSFRSRTSDDYNSMLMQKGKNIIPYELYAAKKAHEPNYLTSLLRKQHRNNLLHEARLDAHQDPSIHQQINQKRIQQIMREHRKQQVSAPEPYIKRTWVSPLLEGTKKLEMLKCLWKKSPEEGSGDLMKAKEICHSLYLNRKIHLCGEFMYCDFEGKENKPAQVVRNTEKKIEGLHRQFEKLQAKTKKHIIICNKDSKYSKNSTPNPLKEDVYFQKIIKTKDEELVKILIQSLSSLGTFTFSSYITFYELFVWQQADKTSQIEFVLKVLMGEAPEVTYKRLSEAIDFMCSKIRLAQSSDSLDGFNEVMKKLIFGKEYEKCGSVQNWVGRGAVRESLEVNEECISILINVFYCE